jgi:Glycosyl transferase family 2
VHKHIMNRMRVLLTAGKLRWRRRKFLFRAYRKRRQLKVLVDRTGQIRPKNILAFSTVRDEIVRLPYFLEYYRKLGVQHFLFVDNNSSDGTTEYLKAQPDVSLWSTDHSYKLARFGVDWLTWLQIKYGQDHWCLTVDADEILVYPHCDTRPLSQMTKWLDETNRRSFGAIMIDMYPKGKLNTNTYKAGDDPFAILAWFDAFNYFVQRKSDLQCLWLQGGVRFRHFFKDSPDRAPTLNKIPLVKWSRRYAYVNSTHSILPRRLNHVYDEDGVEKVTGALLHTKFLHIVAEKSREERRRREHFANSDLYDAYYQSLSENPNFWDEDSYAYRDWRQLVELQLMSQGDWR